MHEYAISSVNTLEIPQSCTEASNSLLWKGTSPGLPTPHADSRRVLVSDTEINVPHFVWLMWNRHYSIAKAMELHSFHIHPLIYCNFKHNCGGVYGKLKITNWYWYLVVYSRFSCTTNQWQIKHNSVFEYTKDVPHLALTDELWGVFCEFFGKTVRYQVYCISYLYLKLTSLMN